MKWHIWENLNASIYHKHVYPLYILTKPFRWGWVCECVWRVSIWYFRLLLAIKTIRPKSTVIRACAMSNQKSCKWINCCPTTELYYTPYATHNFNSAYAFFILIWHIFHVTLCSPNIHTNVLRHSSITVAKFHAMVLLSLSFVRFFLWAIHNITKRKIDRNICRPDAIRWNTMKCIQLQCKHLFNMPNMWNKSIENCCTKHTRARAHSLFWESRKKPLTHTETEYYRAAKG